MKTKKTLLKFGHYSLNPKDADSVEVQFPEDMLFFSGGKDDIGHMKYDSAYHILGITKASEEQIKECFENVFGTNIIYYTESGVEYKLFRINGYAFISFHNCIPVEGLEFTDVDIINNTLDLPNHPVYTVLLNDEYAFCNVERINRICSEFRVEKTSIQIYSQLGSRYYPMIHTNNVASLHDTIATFHKFCLFIPEENYGKELFDEALNTALSDIYPEYKENLKGYDLNYIHDYFIKRTEKLKQGIQTDKTNLDDYVDLDCLNDIVKLSTDELKTMLSELATGIQDVVDEINDIEDIRRFVKKLPIKNK